MPLYAGAKASRLLGDDAFITLTYARSLATGQGFTYHGQPVLGTTTPLLAVLAGGALRLLPGRDAADLAVWLGAAAWLATGWVLFVGRRSLELDLWPATAIAVLTLLAGWTHALGMEAHLFGLLLAAGVVLGVGGRWFLAGIACGLLALARGEGLLLLPVLGCAAVGLSGGRRVALRSVSLLVCGALLVLVPWVVFSVNAFGSPVPATLTAKLAQAESGLWQSFATELRERWLPLWASAWGPADRAIWNPVWWLVAMGIAWAAARDTRMLVPAAWAAVYVAAYAIMGVPSYPWYSLPVMLVLQWLAALGAARIRDLPRPRPPGGQWRLALSIAAVAYLWAGAAIPRVSAVRTDRGDARAASYLGIVEWLERNVPEGTSVAFIEIGYLGYFSNHPVVDLGGLVTPGVADHVRRGDFAAGFYENAPGVFLHLADFDWALADIVTDPRFRATYEPVASLPGPREAPVVVYRLRAGTAR
jgi:hypothetical protein